jgi:hypothetical protein
MLMPRTIDKLRGQLPGGNPGPYFINGIVKGISGYLLERLGISEAQLLEAIASAESDADVARWLRAQTEPAQYEAINATLKRIKPKHAEEPQHFYREYAQTLAEHPELIAIVDIVDADDRRLFPEVRRR